MTTQPYLFVSRLTRFYRGLLSVLLFLVLFPLVSISAPADTDQNADAVLDAPRSTPESDGSLDSSWGSDGTVTTHIGSINAHSNGVAIQDDDKIVVVGTNDDAQDSDIVVVRYNSEGNLDTNFGSNGIVTTNISNNDYGRAVAIQSDGKIVVAGSSNGDFAVVRYNSSGTLDNSFSSDGKVTTDFGSNGSDTGIAVALQTDGKIVVAGHTIINGNADFAVVRYDSYGSLDSSFGGDGKVSTPIGPTSDLGKALAIQLDGKIVVAGDSWSGSNWDSAVVRYNSNGTLDSNFGSNGKVTTDFGSDNYSSAIISQDGKIVVAGYMHDGSNRWDFTVARYNSQGTLDSTFSNDGKVITNFSSNDLAHDLALQSNRKIVVAGTSGNSRNFAVVRYNSNGSLDNSFNDDGLVMTAIGSGTSEGYGVAIQSDGKIIVAGKSFNGSDWDFSVVRYGYAMPLPTNTPTPTTTETPLSTPTSTQTGPPTDPMTLVSVASDGTQGDSHSYKPSISPDGRFVAFYSEASNLVNQDTNGFADVFVRNQQTGETTRISMPSENTQANNNSYNSSISDNGSLVAFESVASNLVNGDTNGSQDIFVYDSQSEEISRVSVASDGTQGNDYCWKPSISADGNLVAFSSNATNLVSEDTNDKQDVFVHDREMNQTTLISVASDETQGNGHSSEPSISADGRFVAFLSDASNLVSGDTNERKDIFVYDRTTHQTSRISVDSNGTEGNNNSNSSISISADGSFVTFSSAATNLVSGDTNGKQDVFLHNRETTQTALISVASDGTQGNGTSSSPFISGDGNFVTFSSAATNLVSGDTNDKEHVFVHDRQTGETRRVSLALDGTQGNNASSTSSISTDGRFVTFGSLANNLVSQDSNDKYDIFLHDREGIAPTPTLTLTPTETSTPTPTATITATPTSTPSAIYVKADATGANNGSSWADAYTNLQDAFTIATSGNEIWVAAGTYKPSGIDRTVSFQLASGVGIYGGFDGTETSRQQRDPEANPTILSGDLSGNDNDNVAHDEPTRAENSYHVVIASDTDSSAMLDGFTITGGNANLFPLNGRDNHGGGMLNINANPTISHLIFTHNSALSAGGGMHNRSNSSPTISDVTLTDNSAGWAGGGMANWWNSSPTLLNVTIASNYADRGGGMFNSYVASNPTLLNVTFTGNLAIVQGGGMSNESNSHPTLVNVTFSGNSAGTNGGGIYHDDNSDSTITNSILWNNQDAGGTDASAQIHGSTSAITVTYSLVQGGFAGAGNIDSDPLFISPIQPTDAPTTTGDFHLQPTSPALDAGDNSAVPADTTDLDGDGDTTEPLPLDLDGNARFIDAPVADSGNGTAPIVDMGAYEKADGSPTPTPTATNTPTPTATPTNPTATPTTPPTGTPMISDVRTSNVRDVSFTVSWLTDIVTSGEVRYGTDPNNLNQTAYDLRGSTIVDETHYVSLAELLENTTYYFDVISADVTDNNNGMHYSVTTAPTLDVPSSDTIYGQILQADGSTPAVGAIVYITLQDANGAGSASQAALLSALAESNGNWSTNLGNARTEDFSGYFLYSASGDRLSLEALGGSNDSGCQRIDTANDAPSAAIVLDGSLCTTTTWSINIQPSWNHIALPLDPVVPYTTESLCAISQGSSIDEVARWYNGGWNGHLCDQPFNNFTLALGAGYFIRANQADTWTITGTAVTVPVPFDLQIGWNSINIPHTDAYTAESLCDDIISQAVTAIEIDRWHLGGWNGHICGLSFNDYPIERGTGYFVKTSSSGSVTPSELAGTVTPSELAGKRKRLHLPPILPDDIPTGETMPVRELHISNLNDTSVTLSWLTDEATTGYVRFGSPAPPQSPPILRSSAHALGGKSLNNGREERIAYDSRGATTSSTTHVVVLDKLTPESTYHFEIVSGAEVGESGSISTLSSLESVPDSDSIYGQLFWSNGSTPAAGRLVYLTLQDADGADSQGEGTVLSVLTDNNGYWHANLGNARLAEGGEPFSYSATGDEVVLTVPSGTDSSTITLDTSQLRPAAPIILEERALLRLYLPLIGN